MYRLRAGAFLTCLRASSPALPVAPTKNRLKIPFIACIPPYQKAANKYDQIICGLHIKERSIYVQNVNTLALGVWAVGDRRFYHREHERCWSAVGRTKAAL